MTNKTKSLNYRIYLLTIWDEREQEDQTSPRWRFCLKDPRTSQQRGFANLTELIIALHTELIENQPEMLDHSGEQIPLKPEQHFLIQKSFALIRVKAGTVAELFYRRLFELDPTLRGMFQNDMTAQERKLINTLKLAVHNMQRWNELVPMLETLARQHAGYGVTQAHYDTAAEALLWALAQSLGPDFTPAVKAAWAELYALLAGVMIKATVEIAS
jgi:hemoglobin-like flavoprotein